MRTLIGILLAFFMASAGTAFAKAEKDDDGVPTVTITEIDPLSITVSVAKDGNLHKTYKIASDSKVTVDEVAASVSDLRAGMLVKISASTDGVTALSVNACDPKKAKRHKHSWR